MIREIKNPPTNIAGYDPLRNAEAYNWNGEAAARAVDYFPQVLTHPDDSPGAKAGTPINLMQWQRDYVATLYGWEREKGVRRYQETNFFVPRKNTKTTLFSGITLYEQTAMNRVGAQFYSAATEKDQASLVFRIAAAMVRNSPLLSKMLKVIDSTRRIVYHKLANFYRAIPSEASSAHGFKPAFVTFDELHTQISRDLFYALSTGFGSTVNPLFASISTAGTNRHTICWDVWNRSRQIRDGILDVPDTLPLIYEIKDGESWHDEAVWIRCNPGIGQSVSLDFLRKEYRKAVDMPSYENTFRNLYLNEWTEQVTRWLPMDKWALGSGELPDLNGAPCWGGLDLSTTTDLSALVLAFPIDGRVYLVCRFWAPRERVKAREQRDRIPYSQWAAKGLLTLTDGDVIDYDVIRRDINELAKRYDIKELAIDRWNATQITTQLTGDGIIVTQHGQGYASMSGPAKEFEKLVLGGQIHHGGHELLTWNAANVAIEQDAAGNIKPSKAKSTERIDGIVSAVMAVGRAAAAEQIRSVYESRGIVSIGSNPQPEPVAVTTAPDAPVTWGGDWRDDDD